MDSETKVILDANFVVDLVRFKVGFEELEALLTKPYVFVTLKRVVGEIEKINDKHSRVALRTLEIMKVEIVKIREMSVDDAILGLAKKDPAHSIVATNDSELRKKLKKAGVKTIYLRARKHLEII